MTTNPRRTPHPFAADPDVPADQLGRRTCTCGLPEKHPRHTLPPAPPEQAVVLGRYDHEEGG